METKHKQFQVQFPEHMSQDEQRQALNKLNAAFDRQSSFVVFSDDNPYIAEETP